MCYVLLSQLWLPASYEWVMFSVLPSTALLSSCRLMSTASFVKSVHLIFALLLSLLSSIFSQKYFFSQITLPSHDVTKIRQLRFCYSFLRNVIFQSNFEEVSSEEERCSSAHRLDLLGEMGYPLIPLLPNDFNICFHWLLFFPLI